MYTLFAATAIAAAMGGPDHLGHRCLPGFAPAQPTTGYLATMPPEDTTRVHSATNPGLSGRLWVGQSFSAAHGSDRSVQLNPGNLAYGAVDSGERVHARVGHVVVSISPWQRIEAEGLEHLERARGQWLQERGYTGGVRTFVNPKRARDAAAGVGQGASSVSRDRGMPEPSATIRLREPRQQGGVIRGVDAGVRGGSRVIAVTDQVRISLPPSAGRDLVARCEARGWTGEGDGTEITSADNR